jgi:hypothetical protein
VKDFQNNEAFDEWNLSCISGVGNRLSLVANDSDVAKFLVWQVLNHDPLHIEQTVPHSITSPFGERPAVIDSGSHFRDSLEHT